jgi:DNA-binding transcriptional ArsR family regulator
MIMETFFERQMRKMVEFSIGGTRGGPMRLCILESISKRPRNTNEIARELKIDYKTAEYHLRVLKESGIVVGMGKKYGSKFSVSPLYRSWEKAHKAECEMKNRGR